jgi:hypothetical protein
MCIILWGGLFHLYHAVALMEPLTPDENECACSTPVHVCPSGFNIADLPPLQDRDVMTAVRNICQSFEYCVQPANRLLGASSIAFPLQVVISTLREFPGREREIWWCSSALDVIDRKGFRILKFAKA